MIDTDTYQTAHLDILAAQLEIFAKIERHLGTLADYADMLRIQATGEKVYEVQGYVVSATSNNDRCVYLYATHPGLQYRVCTVYEERLAELPFTIPATAKIWDGEAAPSREGAAKKGYMLGAPHPFKVSLLPTGGTTDAGLPVHKFNRVIGETQAPPIQTTQAPRAGNGSLSDNERIKAQLREEASAKAAFLAAQDATQGQAARNDTNPGRSTTDGFDGLRSATEDARVKELLAEAERLAAQRAPAFAAPTPEPTHQELDQIAAGDENPVTALVAEMRALAANAKNQPAASAITKSAEGQLAGLHAEKAVRQAIKALKGMQ